MNSILRRCLLHQSVAGVVAVSVVVVAAATAAAACLKQRGAKKACVVATAAGRGGGVTAAAAAAAAASNHIKRVWQYFSPKGRGEEKPDWPLHTNLGGKNLHGLLVRLGWFGLG